MSRRIVIKLGSNIVADDDGDLRVDTIEGVCRAVAQLRGQGAEVLVVSSGAIASGVSAIGLPARPRAIAQLQAASAIGQGEIYQAWRRLLAAQGVISAQVLITFGDMAVRSSYLNARRALRTLLRWNVVPVINENDTIATDEISFGDNDFLAAQVAVLAKADLLLLLTDVDGLFTADPAQHRDATLVRQIDRFEELAQLDIPPTTSKHGSGGMRSKVLAAEIATGACIKTVILNGLAQDALSKALHGDDVGTSFAPRRRQQSSFKLWLRYAKPARGSVVVDAGAARALTDGGGSLLPVGILEVRGSFSAGDAVQILAQQAQVSLGKGISNYSDKELRKIIGRSSGEIQQHLPGAVAEAIHRDRLVVEREALA